MVCFSFSIFETRHGLRRSTVSARAEFVSALCALCLRVRNYWRAKFLTIQPRVSGFPVFAGVLRCARKYALCRLCGLGASIPAPWRCIFQGSARGKIEACKPRCKIFAAEFAQQTASRNGHKLFQPPKISFNTCGSMAFIVTSRNSLIRFALGSRSWSTSRRTRAAGVMPSDFAFASSQSIWTLVKAIDLRFVFMDFKVAPLVLRVKGPA